MLNKYLYINHFLGQFTVNSKAKLRAFLANKVMKYSANRYTSFQASASYQSYSTNKGRTVWARNEKGVEMITMTDEILGAVLSLMRKFYFPSKSIARAVQLHESHDAMNEIQLMMVHIQQEGHSLVAMKDGNIVGAVFNKLASRNSIQQQQMFDQYIKETCNTENAKEFISFPQKINSFFDVYSHYGVTTCFKMQDRFILPEFHREDVGMMLFLGTEALARRIHAPLISSVCTSLSTLRICENQDFEKLLTTPMSQFKFKGQPYSLSVDEDNQNIFLTAKRLYYNDYD